MKCLSCPYGDHYLVVPDEVQDDEETEGFIEVVQCPFGDQVFHVSSQRCSKFKQRKRTEEGNEYVNTKENSQVN